MRAPRDVHPLALTFAPPGNGLIPQRRSLFQIRGCVCFFFLFSISVSARAALVVLLLYLFGIKATGWRVKIKVALRHSGSPCWGFGPFKIYRRPSCPNSEPFAVLNSRLQPQTNKTASRWAFTLFCIQILPQFSTTLYANSNYW